MLIPFFCRDEVVSSLLQNLHGASSKTKPAYISAGSSLANQGDLNARFRFSVQMAELIASSVKGNEMTPTSISWRM